MKVMTFFSEKGGMGKTTFTAMFASWLAYDQRKDVCVLDFDFPGFQMMNMRRLDEKVLEQGGSQLSVFAEGNTPFPIYAAKANYNGYSLQQLEEIASKVRKFRQSGNGYLLCDFPGRFLRNDPAYHIIKEGLMDLVVFPIDTDRQSITSMLNIHGIIRNPSMMTRGKDQRLLVLWNKETQNERKGNRDWYAAYDPLFKQMDIQVCGTRMRNIEILRRDPPTFGFVRNTVCWPVLNVQQRCPYIVDIFREIKERLDGTWVEPSGAENVK